MALVVTTMIVDSHGSLECGQCTPLVRLYDHLLEFDRCVSAVGVCVWLRSSPVIVGQHRRVVCGSSQLMFLAQLPGLWEVQSVRQLLLGRVRHEAAGTHLPLLRCGFLTHKQPKVSAPCACLTMAAHPSSYTCSQQSIPGVHAWSYNEVICCYDVLGNVCSHWAELQVNACARATCMRTCRMHAAVELQIARLHVLPYLRVWSTCMVMQSDHAAQDIFSMLRLPRGSQPAIMHSSHEAPGYCIPQQGRP